jgi:hypothetical protein
MIDTFAEQHRLKVTRDDCGDPVIAGRIYQSNIYEYSNSELGVMLVTDGKKPPRTQVWNKFKTACLGAGMVIRQQGDAEGAFSFNPANPEQAKVAIKGINAKIRRIMTPEQLATLAKVGFKARNATLNTSVST